MLFQRLFNWIKYKTLPVSFFFKNRLFIERDTKHRRIYTMFGVIFRNSKWNNFERPNIKYQFRFKYLKFIIFSLLFMFLFFSFFFKKYLNQIYALGEFNYLFWLTLDSFDYYLTFMTWIIIFFFYFSVHWVYTYLLEQIFQLPKIKTNKKTKAIFSFFREKNKEKINKKAFTKNEMKYLFLYWLKTANDIDKIKYFELIFENKLNKKLWVRYYDFFIKNFKAVYYCTLLSNKYTIKTLHFLNNAVYNNKIDLIFFTSVYANLLNHNFIFLLWYYLKNCNNYFTTNNIKFANNLIFLKYHWNITEYATSNFKNKNLKKNFSNLFYYVFYNNGEYLQQSHNLLELWNLDFFFKNQIKNVKWNRWLYKYSLLHRRFIKNSHKLTLVKKLLSSGFYDKRFLINNTWSTHRQNKINKTLITNLIFMFSSNLFDIKKFNTWSSYFKTSEELKKQKNNLINLSFYENSFLWYTKKFFLSNTIPTNSIKSSFKLSTYDFNDFNLNSNLISYYYFLIKLASSFKINTNEFLIFENFLNCSYNVLNNTEIVIKKYDNKDYFLLFEDLTFFNLETLDICYWVINNTEMVNYKIQYFNYFFSNFTLNKNIVTILNFSLISYKNFYLYNNFLVLNYNSFKDLFFFSFFN